MQRRIWILTVACLLAVGGAWLFWPHAPGVAVSASVAPAARLVHPGAAPIQFALSAATTNAHSAVVKTNPFAYRLSNTTKTVGELTVAPHAILLENALIDTAANRALDLPAHLRATAEPGAYIVQARGLVDGPFRAVLAGAGAQIVSYIPNNAYLVKLSAGGAAGLSANALVQAVLPFAPYFKLQPSLLGLAVEQKPLPSGQVLTLGLFSEGAAATVAQLEKMGGKIVATDRSPFGPIVRVQPPADWIAMVQLPGVQRVEPTRRREVANDMSRTTIGVSADTVTNVTYLGLSGSNVLVEVNDTGIDVNHPDFTTGGNPTTAGAAPIRVIGDSTNSLWDVSGHGTHVAGIIAGNGSKSINPTNVGAAARGSLTNADFRGKAPLANLFSVGFSGANDNTYVSDAYLQETPARTNALISNNSWVNGGGNVYDLSAASYDAATRDAVPGQTGPQPVLFVFAAGNNGGGADNGGGGSSDTVLSPGTAKNVITVGSLEQFRNITNTYQPLGSTNETLVWDGETSSGSQVAAYSSRGNVGVQTEGDYGRFKPDVVAPGTFVVSTRSTTWDKVAYYNRTNYHNEFSSYDLYVDTNTLAYGGANVPINAVSVRIQAVPNSHSPTPFPILPLYISSTTVPDPTDGTTYDFVSSNNVISIPPDNGGTITDIGSLLNGGFVCAVADGTNIPVNFDLRIQVVTTNDYGNLLEVLSNLNETLGPYYYYETGTSIAAPSVSGTLALMQDFFTNTLHTTPSPALLKAMLINGARLSTGYNEYMVTNSINYEGWGLVNLPNSIPSALTNTTVSVSNGVPMFFLDQSPTNVLATGDSRTYNVSVPTPAARNQMMRITLAWTDPPGNPAAGVKLVNNLDLVVTNLATGAVYYGNNLTAATTPFSVVVNSNTSPDSVNNVENVFLPVPLGTNYAVTVIGRNVTVNAVTLEQTNIVQDYALVISCGDSANTNGITVTPAVANVPGPGQPITYVGNTNSIYYNQVSGANAPWLSTNTSLFGTNSPYFTNASLSIGQTNQWHFFIVTNTTPWTNAAFIVFLPNTLAIPRLGVFAGTDANATRPEADLDMFVTSPLTDPNAGGLTNLNPVTISNCVQGVLGDATALNRGGTEFVVYSNSTLGQVYYIGVQAEDQMAAQFAFLPIFSQEPFSRADANGNQIVTGLLLPAEIPDGNNAHPGRALVMGLATMPMQVGGLTVSNAITHQNFGDLLGVLTHGTRGSAVLNNHDGLPNPVIDYTTVYNDDGLPNTRHTDGPGSLRAFRGQEAIGPWILSEIDDSMTQTGAVTGLTFIIRPHRDLRKGLITVSVPAGSWFYDYVDVPVGYTNITVVATNLPPTSVPPIVLALQFNTEPTISNNIAIVGLTNGTPPGNLISDGPPLAPGRYFVGVFNPDTIDHDVVLGAFLTFDPSAITRLNFKSAAPVPLLDDAVTYDYMYVTNTAPIQEFNVGLRVDHQRISDLAFHLISPDGSRFLLMENRGGQSTNGCGLTIITTNIIDVPANGGAAAQTNYIDTGMVSGTLPITYNFYTAPDEMTVYYGTNIAPENLILDTGFTNNPSLGGGAQNTQPETLLVTFPPPTATVSSTILTIIMNQFGNPNTNTAWWYRAGGVLTNFEYLTFTEDTNQTMTPIKFAATPLVPLTITNFVIQTNITFLTNSITLVSNSFEAPVVAGNYLAGSSADNWLVVSNQVSVIRDLTNVNAGAQFLALASGTISRSLPTQAGATNILRFAYRGPGALGLWRGENNPADSVGPNDGVLTNGAGFFHGQVNQSFSFNGAGQFVHVPAFTNLNAIGNQMSIDFWMFANASNSMNTIQGLVDTDHYGIEISPGFSARIGVNFYVDTTSGSALISSVNGGGIVVTSNAWHHIAGVYDGTKIQLYIDGLPAGSSAAASGNLQPMLATSYLSIGSDDGRTYCGCGGRYFNGLIDEATLYKRALSFAEIQAIYNAGILGKYDQAAAFPQNLAKLNLALSGVSTNLLFGSNTNWQTNTISFVATTNSTALQISGLQPGMLLDSFALTSFAAVTNYVTNMVVTVSNLYYLPEQSIDSLISTSPQGWWQLEVLDNRAGATNNATLLSWQLGFTFANTNHIAPPVLPTVTNYTIIETTLLTVTNTATDALTNLTLSYSLSGPTNAVISTNGIITWTPTEEQGPSTNNFVTTVSDNSNPVNKSQNFFSVIVLESNLPPVLEFPTNTTVFRILETALFITNALASDPDIPTNTLTFALVSATDQSGQAVTGLTVTSDGTIQWTPDETNGPSTNVIWISVTDTNPPAVNQTSFSVTNSFTIIVLESNLPPVVFPPSNTNIDELVPWSALATATDPDIPTNTLTFSLVDVVPPLVGAQLTVSPAGVIDWTPDEFQGPGDYTVSIRVTDFNPWAVNQQSLSATNSFTIHVNEVNVAPVWHTPTNYFVLLPAVFMATNAATDTDYPVNPLTYVLLSGPTNAAMIDPTNGIVSWPSTNGMAGSNYLFVVAVTDTNAPAVNPKTYTVTNQFWVTVIATNHAPRWTNSIGNFTLDELTTTNIFVTAIDTDTPPNLLTYKLLNAPVGMTVTNSGPNALITWTPSEAQGPGVYSNILVVVSDNVFPNALTATNLPFTVTVNEINLAPYWLTNNPGATNFVMDELTTLTVTNTANDDDIPTNLLTYTLTVTNLSGGAWPVTNVDLSTNGIITWTPDESQGPGTYLFTTIVTDTNPPAVNAKSLSATNQFTVTVNEVNTPPVWNFDDNSAFYIIRPNVFVLTNAASDADIPTNVLTYALVSGPTNSAIDPNTGVITWPSAGSAIGQTYNFVAVVTDTNPPAAVPSYSVTNNFSVTVVASNSPPYWPAPVPDQTWNEMATNIITVTALDTDLPPNHLTYSLRNAPTGMTIRTVGANGVIRWVPSEVQGPGFYPNILVVVSDNVFPSPALVTNAPFSVTVNEVNRAPRFLGTPANRSVATGTTLVIANPATDPDFPVNPLTYSLLNPPSGADVDRNSGLLTLTLDAGVNVITTVVTDYNSWALFNQHLTATNSFTVTVTNVPTATNAANISPLSIVSTTIGGINGYLVSWFAPTNYQFHLQWTPALLPMNWANFNGVLSFIAPNSPTNVLFQYFDDGSQTGGFGPARFYRLLLLDSPTNTAPFFLTNPGTLPASVDVQFTYPDAAKDWDVPSQALTYLISNSLAGPNLAVIINTGTIYWTPDASQAGMTNELTITVVDNGVPAKHATHVVKVVVAAVATPFASALPAKSVTGTAALLNGFVSPNGTNNCTAWFEYGASRYYGSTTALVNVGGSSGVVYLTAPVAGLINGQNYHYRLVVSNSVVTTRSFDRQFGVGHLLDWGTDIYHNQFGNTGVPAGLGNVAAMDIGYASSLALMPDGTIDAWGINFTHLLEVPAGLNNAVALAIGRGDHGAGCLALKADGTVAVWGDNSLNELYLPAGLNNVVAVSAGNLHSLALKADGTVVAWGASNILASIAVPAGLSNVVAIAAGDGHNLALKNDGTVVAWGSDSIGQTEVPASLSNVVAVAAGGYSIALKADGTVVAWGTNYNNTLNTAPASLNNVVQVACGDFHGLALKADGSIVAWGDDAYGELDMPAGVSNVVAVAAGRYKNLAQMSANPLNATNPPAATFSIGSVSATGTNGLTLQWTAPVYAAFQVRWATNLVPPMTWNLVPDVLTSTNGSFHFTDTNPPLLMKFYELLLLP